MCKISDSEKNSWQNNDQKLSKMQSTYMRSKLSVLFFTKLKKKTFTEKFMFYIVAFDPIKVLTGLAPQFCERL